MKGSVKGRLDCKAAWLKYDHLNLNKSSVERCSKYNPTVIELCLYSNESRWLNIIVQMRLRQKFVTSYNVFSAGLITIIIVVSLEPNKWQGHCFDFL